MIVKLPEWKTFATLHALDSFRQYWAESERLIEDAAQAEEQKNGPKWVVETEEEYAEFREEQRIARHVHDEIIKPTLRYSCVVMLYAIVESELRRLVDNLEKEHGTPKLKLKDIRASSFLSQVQKYIEAFFNVQLSHCPEYSALCDLQKIRDCIVHCRGEVSLYNENDRKYLIGLKDRRKGFFAWEGTDLDIESACVDQFITEVRSFFVWVFQQLKWKIDDSWPQTKPS